jgi:hypothetical protein
MPQDDLERRVARLEAIADIQKLKALYCLHCDRGYDADALALLFTEDAVWDAGPVRGVHRGREAIREFFRRVSAVIPYAAHLATNPVIEADGDSGSGRWRMLMPCTLVEGGRQVAAFQVADYAETYRRVEGRWLIASLEVRLQRLVLPGMAWRDAFSTST